MKNNNELGTYRNDRAASRSSRVRRAADDILPGKQPVPPAEAAHVVQGLQVQDSRLLVLDSEVADTELLGFRSDVGKEVPMRAGTVGAELVKNLGQWSVRHGDLEEMVQKWYLYAV